MADCHAVALPGVAFRRRLVAQVARYIAIKSGADLDQPMRVRERQDLVAFLSRRDFCAARSGRH